MGCCGKAKRIVKGHFKNAFGIDRKLSTKRMIICHDCDRRMWKQGVSWCKECYCFLPAKTKVKEEICPLGKWPSL